MPSFDIVSTVNISELENAINNVIREVGTRYDFRDSKTVITLDKKEKVIQITSSDNMKMDMIEGMIRAHSVRRKVDPKCLEFKKCEPTSQGALKRDVKINEGISKDLAREIVKLIKELGLKVQAAIQDEQVRVTAKKIDDLQTVIQAVKAKEYDTPLQYVNMKS